MLCVSQALQGMGFPGFQVQLVTWLSGRVSVPRLRRAIERFARAHPVICSRLQTNGDGASPCWRYHTRVDELLHETELSASGPAAVHEEASRLLSLPSDLSRQNPICFHLLHSPDGRDVLLLQFDHVLMDNNAGLRVLKEINRLAECDGCAEADSPVEDRDWSRWYLRKIPWQRRKQAVSRNMKQWRGIVRSVAMLGRIAPSAPGPGQLRLATRMLSTTETKALEARVLEKCGLPSLSMLLLASAFRGIAKLTPQRFRESFRLVAALGLDLGLRSPQRLLCQNAASLMFAHVEKEDLADQAGLVRLLSQQFRDVLVDEADMGLMQMLALLSRRPDQARRLIEVLLQLGGSLWFGYFGTLDLPDGTFCDVPVDNVGFFGPCWSPMGLTLLANQTRGRLQLHATYVPESISEARVNEFLDFVMADLAAF